MLQKNNILNTKIGLLGGGQLGKMLLQEAINLDLNISVLDSNPDAPCSFWKNYFVGDIQNYDDVLEFGKDKDILTFEIENVNLEALFELEKRGVKVYPKPSNLKIIKDKSIQKKWYLENEIPTGRFQIFQNLEDFKKFFLSGGKFQELQKFQNFQNGFVLKTAVGGYDGSGVKVFLKEDLHKFINSEGGFVEEILPKVFQNSKLLMEEKVDFVGEIAVIVARNSDLDIQAFPVCDQVMDSELNLVSYLSSPSKFSNEIQNIASEIAKKIAKKIDLIGLLAVEFFVTKDGQVLVNEVAPRPHNSGHHTIEGATISQFMQFWKAILNLPLIPPEFHSHSAMINLIGKENSNSGFQIPKEIYKIEKTYIHLYGKKENRIGRKMGHLTILDNSQKEIEEKVSKIKQILF